MKKSGAAEAEGADRLRLGRGAGAEEAEAQERGKVHQTKAVKPRF